MGINSLISVARTSSSVQYRCEYCENYHFAMTNDHKDCLLSFKDDSDMYKYHYVGINAISDFNSVYLEYAYILGGTGYMDFIGCFPDDDDKLLKVVKISLKYNDKVSYDFYIKLISERKFGILDCLFSLPKCESINIRYFTSDNTLSEDVTLIILELGNNDELRNLTDYLQSRPCYNNALDIIKNGGK
jgi:hypothetical protein